MLSRVGCGCGRKGKVLTEKRSVAKQTAPTQQTEAQRPKLWTGKGGKS